MTRRIHLPDGTSTGDRPAGTTQAPVAFVKDEHGNDVPLPGVYIAAVSKQAAEQLYAIGKAAAADGVRELLVGICQLLMSALSPPAPPTEADPPPVEAAQ